MFYPIPSTGGRYEIDEKGNVRNAITEKLLTADVNSYCLCIDGKRRSKTKAILLAEVFDKPNDFVPIPSLGGKYEINQRGIVRNSATKNRITPRRVTKNRAAEIDVRGVDGKLTSRSLQQLMWEVHGVLPTSKCCMGNAIPVQVQRQGEYRRFNSYRQCALFLAPKVHYSHHHLRKLLSCRIKQIGEWQIFYKQPDERVIKPYHVTVRKGFKE